MDGRAFFRRIVEQDPSRGEGFSQARAEVELALRIAEQRSEAQLTQDQLAGRIGISQPVIARLELGGRTPTLPTLWKLATALRVEFHVKPEYGIDVVPAPGGALPASNRSEVAQHVADSAHAVLSPPASQAHPAEDQKPEPEPRSNATRSRWKATRARQAGAHP